MTTTQTENQSISSWFPKSCIASKCSSQLQSSISRPRLCTGEKMRYWSQYLCIHVNIPGTASNISNNIQYETIHNKTNCSTKHFLSHHLKNPPSQIEKQFFNQCRRVEDIMCVLLQSEIQYWQRFGIVTIRFQFQFWNFAAAWQATAASWNSNYK